MQLTDIAISLIVEQVCGTDHITSISYLARFELSSSIFSTPLPPSDSHRLLCYRISSCPKNFSINLRAKRHTHCVNGMDAFVMVARDNRRLRFDDLSDIRISQKPLRDLFIPSRRWDEEALRRRT